jgi:hypothetical protein
MIFYRRIIINPRLYFLEKNSCSISFHSVFIFGKYPEKKRFSFKIDLLKFEALILAAKNLL